jgi:hypothetical protein
MRDKKPDVVVVELGTNGCECLSVAQSIDAVMRQLRSVPRVYWVNVREEATIPENPSAINNAIESAEDRWSNLDVIDFDEHFRGHADWIKDFVHPNERGNQEFAKLIADALPAVKR